MSPPAVSARALQRALAAAAALLLAPAAPAAADRPERGDFDARARGAEQVDGAGLRARLGRFGLVASDPRTGTPRAVAKLDGFLTGPSGGDAAGVALGYVRDHAGVFRLDAGDVDALRLARRSSAGGIEHLAWEQRYRGIPSADTQLRAAVTASGRLLSLTGAPAPDLAVGSIEPAVGAARAYAAVDGASATVRRREGGAERATTFRDGGRASLVLFQDGDGTRLGWRVLAPVSSSAVYDAIVDARSGAVVRRANRVDFAGAARIFRSNPRDTKPQDLITFPDAWLAPGATRLKGPYAHAFVDPTDFVGPDRLTPRAQDEVGDWDDTLQTFSTSPSNGCSLAAPCTWSAVNPTANRDQSATQLFYFVNTFRDHLAAAPIGFTGFEGDDPVIAQAMDGASMLDEGYVNNASFLTLEEGASPLLQVHLFSHEDSPFGDYDGANDASLVFHEYTHGLSSRLVTDAQGFAALSTAQAGAIGEATSDFYALDYLVEHGMPDGAGADVRLGTYFDDPDGLRLQAIDTPAATGLNYADFGDGGPEVHDDGEIWAQTLWDLRTELGVPAARAVITQALRLAPPEPSFLDMRNAILEAHQADDGPLWDIFAARGMGYFASTDGSTDIAPVDDDSLPPPAASSDTLTGTVRDDDAQPLAGARVAVAGHDTGLGPELSDDTDAGGAYAIRAPVGAKPYPLVVARRTGYREDRATNVTVPAAGVDFALVRDWSSAANGATVERFTGIDHTADGCGPGGLIDDRSDSVWGSERTASGQTIVIDLGAPVDVAGVAIDPGAGCGDDFTAGLRDYEVRGGTGPDGEFRPLGPAGTFPPDQGGALRDLVDATAPRVRYVQLHAKTPQITAPGTSGADFLDVAELHVAKTPGSPLGPSADTGSAQGVGATAAGLTGTVVPRGGTTQVLFEYGPTAAYGSSVAAQTLAAGDAAAAVGAAVAGLQPLSLYHFRVVAVRDGVRYEGSDATFVTTAAQVQLPPPPGPAAALARIVGRKLTADRRGRFKVRVAFAAAAPAGTARVRVLAKGKRLAATRLAVRPGQGATAKLRLSRAGRRAVRPGRTKRVKVVLRLPGGAKVTKAMKLTRRR